MDQSVSWIPDLLIIMKWKPMSMDIKTGTARCRAKNLPSVGPETASAPLMTFIMNGPTTGMTENEAPARPHRSRGDRRAGSFLATKR